MQTLTIAEAGQQFARLMEQVEQGEVIQITNGDKPVGRLVPIDPMIPVHPRIGFLQGQGHVPLNWKELGREEIEADFYGDE